MSTILSNSRFRKPNKKFEKAFSELKEQCYYFGGNIKLDLTKLGLMLMASNKKA